MSKTYKEELYALEKLVNNTPSRVFGSLFRNLQADIKSYKPKGATDKAKIKNLNTYITRRIDHHFQVSKADIQQEVLLAAAKDVIKYDKVLGRMVPRKLSAPRGNSLRAWTAFDYTEIKNAFRNNTGSVGKEILEDLFTKVGYNSRASSIYRGLDLYEDNAFSKRIHALKVGDMFTDKSPTSWSSKVEIAAGFADMEAGDTAVVLHVRKAKGLGYDIADFSEFKEEGEVLIKDGEPLKVVDIKALASGSKEIILEPVFDYASNMFTLPRVGVLNFILDTNFTAPHTKFSGKSIDQMYKSLAKYAQSKAKGQAAVLYMEGLTPNDITYELAKTFGLGGKGKAARSRARAFFNTTVSIAKEDMRTSAEKDYTSFIAGWEFDAHEDGRTTLGCRERDGRKYMKKKPTDTKAMIVPADSTVPRHFNCRSILIPIPYKV